MSKITNNNNTYITHGKSLSKKISDYYNINSDNRITTWILKSDTLHKCNVHACPLFRIYLRHKLWNIGIRAMMYDECMNMLKQHLPDDIVQLILTKSFSK